jgi:cytochrome P450
MDLSLLADAPVPPVPQDGAPGTVAWLRANVARFSSGDTHARRRALAVSALAEVALEGLRPAAAKLAQDLMADDLTAGNLTAGDLAAIGRAVAVAVLGGPPAPVAAVAVAYHSADPAADDAVATLVAWFGGTPDEATAARIGVLVQACDATAGLIERAAASGIVGTVDDIVAATLRDDPPVLATRRLVDGEVRLVSLVGAPFGAGPHACPGREHAIAIASGVLDAYVS